MWGACWLFLTKGAADSDCGCSFGIIQPWHPASLHICENLIQKRSLSRTWAGSQRGRGWQKKGMGDVTEERGGRKEEMKKNQEKGKWWQYLLHQFECLSSQVTDRSAWSANRRENIHFGEERKEEEWEWVREDGARVYLCCVSCHLCVRAHHTNCEACAHTSSVTLLSAGHQHSHIDRVSKKTPTSLFSLRLAHVWLHFAHTLTHTPSLWSTTCMSISEPIARGVVYWGFLLVE